MKTPILLAILLLVSLLSCESKKSDTQTTSSTTMSDSTALLDKRPGPEAPRSAADRLVRALYFEHNKKENPFRDSKSRTIIDQFFTPTLANKIWRNVARKGYKASKVNPLFNAPDAGITKTWVEPAAMGGSRARVYVTFLQGGKPAEVKVDLVQTAGRWRITELTYPGDKTLTGQL